jgi:glutamyl-tRNA synthetase
MDHAGTLAALERAESVLASLDGFGEQALESALRATADDLGLKIGPFLGCLRVACTGKTVAPPLFGTLSLLGRDRVLSRVRLAIDLLASSE